MTDRTSDEDDHADYTDDHQEERRTDLPDRRDGDRTPDVDDGPDFETPD